MFRKRRHSLRPAPETALAEAEAARAAQERKREAERGVKDTLDQLIAENNLADMLIASLGVHNGRRHT